MKSQVVRPPPGRLKTVVLREGPPKGRRRILDGALGAVGVLLLLLAIILVPVLPERDIILPQFDVQVVNISQNISSESFYLAEGQSHEFAFEVPMDNVFILQVAVGFQDDLVESLPDAFEVIVLDAEGRPVGERSRIENLPPVLEETGTGVDINYVAQYAKREFTFTLGPPPEGAFVSGSFEDDTAQIIAERFEAEHHRDTTGTWTVRVTMQIAGDCGTPTDPEFNARRTAMCRSKANDGLDTGNPFSIERIQYTYFEPRVSQL